MRHRTEDIVDFMLDASTKGIPVSAGLVRASEISSCGLKPRSGKLQYPILTMDEAVVDENLSQMLTYAKENNALMAPHGKTPMAPALAQRLVASGCWGISAASLQQTSVFLKAGLENVILANQVGGTYSAAQLASLASRYSAANIYVFVDSLASVSAFEGAIEGVQNLSFLVETGVPAGRNGFRDLEGVEAAIAEISKKFGVDRLGGIGSYEGAAFGGDMDASLKAIEELMTFNIAAIQRVRATRPFGPLVLSAGGSAAYDIVARRLGPVAARMNDLKFIMRGGAFMFHDHGIYDSLLKAMDARSGYQIGGQIVSAAASFKPALRLWAQINSCPEPGLAIAGFGMRDTSYDLELPKVLRIFRDGETHDVSPAALSELIVKKLNDQHAFMSVPNGLNLRVGDILELGISHPCTCFDKWRVFFGLNEEGMIESAYQTFF